jgi:nucleoside-diphosphate-sugar epimerase
MKFIVTGGAGFIGHNVVRQMEALGHECFIMDNITNYGFIPDDELAYLYNERRRRMRTGIHHNDLCKFTDVKDFFLSFSQLVDGVIHLASFPRQKVVSANPVWGSDVMATGLVNLLELTRQFQIPKFIYVSSSMVYGDFDNGATEDAPCNPIGQYGIMKLMGEHLVKDYTRRGCFDHVIIRPSAVYGEFDVEDRVVSKFMLSALRGETLKVNGADEVLDFTHVDDTAKGIVLASTSNNAKNNTFNITRSDTTLHTLLDAAQLAIKIAGKGTIDVQNPDVNFPSRGRLDNTRAKTILGFNPTIDLEEGMTRYAEWFNQSKHWKNKL